MPPAAPKVVQRRVADLTPYAANPRVITDDAVASLAEAIRRFGWTQPIEVDRDGVIINGHARRLAAMLLGIETVPVVVSDLTGNAARAARIADNQAATLTDWDADKLFAEFEAMDDRTALTPAFDADAIDAILGGGTPAADGGGEHATAGATPSALPAERECQHCGFRF